MASAPGRGSFYSPARHDERARSAAERGLVLGGLAALRETSDQLKLALFQNHDPAVAAVHRQLAQDATAIARECLALQDFCAAWQLPPTCDERLAWVRQVEQLQREASRRRKYRYVRALLNLLNKLLRLDWSDDAVWLARLPRRTAE